MVLVLNFFVIFTYFKIRILAKTLVNYFRLIKHRLTDLDGIMSFGETIDGFLKHVNVSSTIKCMYFLQIISVLFFV